MVTKEGILSTLMDVRGRIFASVPPSNDDILTAGDKSIIERYHEIVFRKPFKKTSCKSCYFDAVILMINHLSKNELMPKSNYILKSGVVLQMASDPNVYTNATITDEVAERYLKDNPNRIGFFSSYPEDWEKRIKKENKPNKASKAHKSTKAEQIEPKEEVEEKVLEEVKENDQVE